MARTFQIKGLNKIQGKLKRNANMTDVKNVVKLNGSEMQRAAQRNAPVDTGTLKRNIKYHPLDQGFTAKVASEVDYAAYQEYGTRFMAGKPHIRPAFNQQKRKFIQDMKRLMK